MAEKTIPELLKESESTTLKISETLIIGVDISAGKDVSMLQVARYSKGISTIINTFVGKEAEDMYDQLTSFGHCVKL